MADELRKGLEGVLVAESALSSIDGETGTLRYRGYSIEDLAAEASYEEVLYFLWNGRLPTGADLADFDAAMRAERTIDAASLETLRSLAAAD